MHDVVPLLVDDRVLLLRLFLQLLRADLQLLEELVRLLELELIGLYLLLLHVDLAELLLQLLDNAVLFGEVDLQGLDFGAVVHQLALHAADFYVFVVEFLHQQVLVLLVALHLGAVFRTDGLHLFVPAAVILPVVLQLPLLFGKLVPEFLYLVGLALLDVIVIFGGGEIGAALVLTFPLPVHPIDLLFILLAPLLQILSLILFPLKLRDILPWFGGEVAFGDGLEERVVFLVGLDEGVGGGVGQPRCVIFAGVFGD